MKLCKNSCFLHFIFCNFAITKPHWVVIFRPMRSSLKLLFNKLITNKQYYEKD